MCRCTAKPAEFNSCVSRARGGDTQKRHHLPTDTNVSGHLPPSIRFSFASEVTHPMTSSSFLPVTGSPPPAWSTQWSHTLMKFS